MDYHDAKTNAQNARKLMNQLYTAACRYDHLPSNIVIHGFSPSNPFTDAYEMARNDYLIADAMFCDAIVTTRTAA